MVIYLKSSNNLAKISHGAISTEAETSAASIALMDMLRKKMVGSTTPARQTTCGHYPGHVHLYVLGTCSLFGVIFKIASGESK